MSHLANLRHISSLRRVAVKMSRIQFQPGISLSEFLADYGTEDRCTAAVESARWPTGFTCPTCGNKRHSSYMRGSVKVFQCSICREQNDFDGRHRFPLDKVAPNQVVPGDVLPDPDQTTSLQEMRRLIGVSSRTAWLVKHKLMQVMFEQEQTTKLSAVSKSTTPTSAANTRAAKEGGSENKVPFIAAVQTNRERHPMYLMFSSVKAFGQEDVRQLGQQQIGSQHSGRVRWSFLLHSCRASRLHPSTKGRRQR
jgi:ribosomal protein L37AE/L43A